MIYAHASCFATAPLIRFWRGRAKVGEGPIKFWRPLVGRRTRLPIRQATIDRQIMNDLMGMIMPGENNMVENYAPPKPIDSSGIGSTVIWTAKEGFKVGAKAPKQHRISFDEMIEAGQREKERLVQNTADSSSHGKVVFKLDPTRKQYFLDRSPQIPIDASPLNSGKDWKTVAEAMHAAAAEIRRLAKEYYSNYDDLKSAGDEGILPEAGVRIILKSNGRVTYCGIYPGWARAATDAETSYPAGSGKLVGRLHFHWINNSPRQQDLFAAESLAVGLPEERRQWFEAWVASYETETPYFIARDELKEE